MAVRGVPPSPRTESLRMRLGLLSGGTWGCLFTLAAGAVSTATDQTSDRRVDGDWDEWAEGVYFYADERHVHLRFETPDERTLLRHGQAVVLAIDSDDNPRSGRVRGGVRGIDLLIELNPARDRSRRGRTPSVRATAFDARGDARELSTGDLGLHTAPTHAAKRFELRFDRAARPARGVSGLAKAGPLRASVWLQDHDSQRTQPLGRYTAQAPEASRDDASPAVAGLPDRWATGGDAVRVVSWNTLWGSQIKDPKPFARLAQAMDADVYLLQEWSDKPYTAEEVAAWFQQNVGGGPWTAVTTRNGGDRGSGVAVASRYPLVEAGPQQLFAPGRTRWSFPVRFAGGVFQTPHGPAVFGTVHHKAGGRLGADEDQRRLDESAVIQKAMAGLAEKHPGALVVYGGDFNLNGSYAVMDRSVAGLDTDGSPLAVAEPAVLGKPGLLYTHGRGGSKRRLDYITYADAALTVPSAFVVDTTVLPNATLEALGLNKNDSRASDHLPVVADFVPLADAER